MDRKTIIQIILAVIISGSLVYYFKNPEIEVVETEVVVKETVIVKQNVDSIVNAKLKQFKHIPEKVVVYKDKIIKVNSVDTIYDDGKTKTYNRVKDTAILKNGTIEADLLVDGDVKSIDYKLTTNDSVIVKDVVKTVKEIVNPSVMYIMPELSMGSGEIKNIGTSLVYSHRNKWLLKGGVNYNTFDNNLHYTVGVGLKIKLKQ